MTNISHKIIYDVGYRLLAKAAVQYPKNYLEKLLAAFKSEDSQAARSVIASILQNIIGATKGSASLCQDTGIPTFHIFLNPSVRLDNDVTAALTEATVRATEDVPIRKNVIEPFSFCNPGTNTGWGVPFVYFHYDPKPGPMRIRAELKGFGGEIKSSSDWIFTSTENMKHAVMAYVLNSVLLSKGEDCIPGFLGIGVGGYAAEAVSNAKNAAYRELTEKSCDRTGPDDASLATFEAQLLKNVNRLGLGPMGGGGKTTTLGVYVERRGTHTAASSVAVSHQCWAARGSEALIDRDKVTYLTPHLEEEEVPMLEKAVAEGLSASDARGKIYELQTPVRMEDLLKLRVWDVVYLSGAICTARDGAHRRMVEKVKEGKTREIPREILENGVVFHCGPVVDKEADRWCVHAAGPTTSSRFTDDAAFLVDAEIIKVSLGKGTMGSKMINALSGKGVYLRAVGGCAVSYSEMITHTDVQWLDLGYPEAVWVFHVRRFGPLIVGIDAHGNSLTKGIMETVYENARKIYLEEGLDASVRYVQYPQTFAGLSLDEVISLASRQ